MPIYEYRCQSCGHELEKLQRLNDSVLTDCPECGEVELQRLISAAGFRLKGAGWYETDFKQGNKRNLAESSNDSSGPTSSGANGSDGNGGGAPKTRSPASESGKPDSSTSDSRKSDSSATASSANKSKDTSSKAVSPA